MFYTGKCHIQKRKGNTYLLMPGTLTRFLHFLFNRGGIISYSTGACPVKFTTVTAQRISLGRSAPCAMRYIP